MGIEENKEVMRRYIEGFLNNGDFSEADEIVHEEYTGSAGEGIKGAEGIKQYTAFMRTVVSNGHWEIKEMIAEGEKVSVFQDYTGNFDGELYGIKGKGQPLAFQIAGVYEFKDGKVYRGLVIALTEWLNFYQQIGVIPPQEELVKAHIASQK